MITASQERIYNAVVFLGEQSHDGAATVNRNTDGSGLSYGGIQATQRSGTLGKLLARARRSFPGPFEVAFGPDWSALLAITGRASVEPVGGALLWNEPWVSRFRAAGRTAWMASTQLGFAFSVDAGFWPAVQVVAKKLALRTERSHALVMDRAVNGGPGRAQRAADAALLHPGFDTLDEAGRLGIWGHYALEYVAGTRYESSMQERWVRVIGSPDLTDEPISEVLS